MAKTDTHGGGPSDQAGEALISVSQTTYAIVVRNDGLEPVNDAMLRDTPEAGLPACELAGPVCEVTGGAATCPAAGTWQANGRWPTCDPLRPVAW